MVFVLLVTIIISIAINHYTDATIIVILLFINVVLGFVQEYKAEESITKLKELVVPVSKVRRNGQVVQVESRQIVTGDIVLLAAVFILIRREL